MNELMTYIPYWIAALVTISAVSLYFCEDDE